MKQKLWVHLFFQVQFHCWTLSPLGRSSWSWCTPPWTRTSRSATSESELHVQAPAAFLFPENETWQGSISGIYIYCHICTFDGFSIFCFKDILSPVCLCRGANTNILQLLPPWPIFSSQQWCCLLESSSRADLAMWSILKTMPVIQKHLKSIWIQEHFKCPIYKKGWWWTQKSNRRKDLCGHPVTLYKAVHVSTVI